MDINKLVPQNNDAWRWDKPHGNSCNFIINLILLNIYQHNYDRYPRPNYIGNFNPLINLF